MACFSFSFSLYELKFVRAATPFFSQPVLQLYLCDFSVFGNLISTSILNQMDSFNWSKYQNNQELEESGLVMAASNSFNPIQQIQKSSTDSFPNLFPQWNSRSGNWGAAINAGLILQSSSSSFEYNRPCSTLLSQDTQNGLILEPGIPRNATGFSTNTNTNMSLESLDCLLQSGSNSQTDTTSVEDDGISLIFSDCKSLWNFTNVKPVVTPSADNCKNSQTVARASADHDQNKIIKINQISRFSGDDDDDDNHEPNPTKRKRSESQQKQQNLDFHQSKNSATTDHQSLKHKKPRLDKHQNSSSNINFQQPSSSASSSADEPDPEAVAQMKEIIYRAAAFRPVDFGLEPVEKPKRKNVRISNDPQTVAARQRRERISERIRVLQRLVPGGSKMDTASMLDEAASYLKFLRSQVKALEAFGHKFDHHNHTLIDNFPPNANLGFSPFVNYSFTMQQPQFSFQNPNPINQFKS